MIKVAVIGGTNCLDENMCLVSKYDYYDVLIVSYMSCTMLAKWALGIDEDFTRAILNNKPVYVLKNGLQYKKIVDKTVFQMYSVYRRTLQSFGIKFIESINSIRTDGL
ncbi:MAG: hypothetical protein UH854_07110 [Clostridia bacterium]|nr:hypothetical protein [Clostridia bacterium]